MSEAQERCDFVTLLMIPVFDGSFEMHYTRKSGATWIEHQPPPAAEGEI